MPKIFYNQIAIKDKIMFGKRCTKCGYERKPSDNVTSACPKCRVLYDRSENSGFKIGEVLIFLGCVGLVLAFFMDTSVLTESGKRIVNIGLINDRIMYLIISSVLLIVGMILKISQKRSVADQASESISESVFKTCPFCAEKIQLKAKICRFCNRDQEA